ncbi:MAG TPA: chromate transporter, partial [Stellaceae bacterium]|nr:chromate transporter [Stellaceae bacterium]
MFFSFMLVAAMGFGGVLPWARRMIVERRRWLSESEFLDLLALCQF